MKELVYIKKKGLIYYIDKNSFIISYLLKDDIKEIYYIEKSKISLLLDMLNKCHINYYKEELVEFKDNRYNNYLRYGLLYKKIKSIYSDLVNIIYLDNIDKVLEDIMKLYKNTL